MHGMSPSSLPFAVALVLAVQLALGLALRNTTRIGLAWLVPAFGVAAVEALAFDAPADLRMLALCGACLYGMKAVVSVADARAGGPRLSALRWLGFAVLWFGMRPSVFAAKKPCAAHGAPDLARRGLLRIAYGAALVALALALWRATGARTLATVPLLAGVSLIFHFGVFTLCAAAWRAAGVPCMPLFRAPLASRSLAEFWSRRWNVGFAEMTALAVFRPLAARAGRAPALAAAFLFSGLLHELAISLPVHAGYGLPFLYFALHALALRLEGTRPRGRAWVCAWVVLPLPLLFHRPFVAGVIWPAFGMA